MDDEFGYDSDQIDEETEARFFEMAYYGTSFLEKSTLDADKFDNFSQRPINKLTNQDNKSDPDLTKAVNLLSNLKNDDSNKSSSDENLSQSVISVSSGLSSLGDIFKDKERYQTTMEALYLLITGNYPHCVLERAKKREQEYKRNHLPSRRKHSYYSAATDDDDDDYYNGPPRKSSKMDLILGISNTSNRRHDRDVMPEWFKNLPSDPELWAIDPDDLYPDEEYYNSSDFNGTCENCGLKGHSEEECTRSGPFCVICAREGHSKDGCSYRVCPICLGRGHDSKCRNKHKVNNTVCFRCKQMGHMTNRCPEIWRQYRFTVLDTRESGIVSSRYWSFKLVSFVRTTMPGPPVKFEQPEPKVKRCFNCGRIGHLGHQCNRPSAYGQTLLYQGVTQFDKKDIFAEAPATSKPEYEVVEKQSASDSSAVKKRTFDEPLYISFTSGPSNSLPESNKLLLDTSKDDSPNGNQKKNKRDRLHSLQHDSNHTPNRRNRRKTFGGSRDHFSPIDHHDSSALNGFLSENLKCKKSKTGLTIDDRSGSGMRTLNTVLQIYQDFILMNVREWFRTQETIAPANYSTPMITPLEEVILDFEVILRRIHLSMALGMVIITKGKAPLEVILLVMETINGFEESLQRIPKCNLLSLIPLIDAIISKIAGTHLSLQIQGIDPRFLLSDEYCKEHRDKILKTNKRRDSDQKSLPNIGNSPYLKFISKSVMNSRSPASSSPKQQKVVWKNRLSR
ncbi:hypothetical protein ACTXT7_002173 [Hymenolepis weldensis]